MCSKGREQESAVASGRAEREDPDFIDLFI